MKGHSAFGVDVKSVCVFAGDLLKDITVDYERATSEERLDEVRVLDGECVFTKHNACLK